MLCSSQMLDNIKHSTDSLNWQYVHPLFQAPVISQASFWNSSKCLNKPPLGKNSKYLLTYFCIILKLLNMFVDDKHMNYKF